MPAITIRRGNVEVLVPGRLRGLVTDRDNYVTTGARRISRSFQQEITNGDNRFPLNPNGQQAALSTMRALRNARDEINRLIAEVELVGNLS